MLSARRDVHRGELFVAELLVLQLNKVLLVGRVLYCPTRTRVLADKCGLLHKEALLSL